MPEMFAQIIHQGYLVHKTRNSIDKNKAPLKHILNIIENKKGSDTFD